MKSPWKVFIVLIFALIIIITTVFGPTGVITIFKLNSKIKAVGKEIVLLEKEKERLKMEVEWLEKDKKSLEPFAKEKLFLKRKDEKVIAVIRKKKPDQGL